jgi:type II secretory pathway pseudopilin PulG
VKLSPSFRRPRSRQSGYVLIVLMLLMALLIIALIAVAPREVTQIRRDREEEMIHRGKQYTRAVKLFYRKFGRYPTRVEELESTNNMRFLRKRWKDPTSGQDFRILHYGEQKSVPKGLFGAPMGAVGGGALPGGMAGGGLPGAIIGNTLGGGQQQPGGAGQSGQPQSPGTPASSISSSLGSGPTFGGGPIIGVAGTRNQASIHVWNDKTNYKDWEFYYDPRFDVPTGVPGGVAGGVPGGSPSASPPGGAITPNPQPQPQMPQ